MTPAEITSPDLSETAQSLRDRQQPFAFATIVRTVGATAAKPGAKALLAADGSILEGWLGGGCARSAVKRATVEALRNGAPQLISIAPEEFLAERGIPAGAEQDGITYSRNGCPSRGTIDIFIEPCLPMPELAVFGTSPVAKALARLAPQFHLSVSHLTQAEQLPETNRQRFIVVATQGQGDLAALEAALAVEAEYCSFVGSQRKFAALSKRLAEGGAAVERLSGVKAPAGLDIHAVTPEEIALSILAELVGVRRRRLTEDAND